MALVFLLILLSLQGAQYIEMASGTETQVSKDSQLYKDYDHLFLKTFSTDSIILMVEGNDVGTRAIMKAADLLEQQVLIVPGVTTVSSPASIIKQINYAESGRLKIPDSDREIREMMERYPEYFKNLVIDKTHALIIIQIEGDSTNQQQEDMINNIELALEGAEFPPGYKLTLTGKPSLMLDIQSEMGTSMGTLLGIAGILMVVVLLLVFRNVRWGLLPLPVVLLGVLFTFGVMGISSAYDNGFNGSFSSIDRHWNRLFYSVPQQDGRGDPGRKTSSQALVSTVKNTAPAVLIALVMTALGLSLYLLLLSL